jgi:GTP-binding protein HflX
VPLRSRAVVVTTSEYYRVATASRPRYICAGLRKGRIIPRLHDTSAPPERAILVAAPIRHRGHPPSLGSVEEHLDELARLVDTAGAEVVGRVAQRLARASPAQYVGRGKAAELHDLVQARGASLVVFDEELSPVQGKNLESLLGVRVVDRTEIILAIFARRAQSREARMQVELAQLEYLLPRLARMWVHLSRIRGGIGLRGPGEAQIETDRRLIRRRISGLKKKLERVARHRRTVRQGRRAIPTVALVGYTNAGKSSLLNALSGANAFVEDRLFATLDTLVRECDLQPGLRVRLVDTVGFIRKLPHHLVASFRATLEEAAGADALIHVVDGSHPDWEDQVRVVNEVLAAMVQRQRPTLTVLNKLDRVPDPAPLLRAAGLSFGDVVGTSLVRPFAQGLEGVRTWLARSLASGGGAELRLAEEIA